MAQYAQRVDESVYVQSAVLQPGWRGRARTIPHYPDWLTEIPIGPIRELNRGFPFTYLPQRVKTFVPNAPVLRVARNGNPIQPYKFKSRPIEELSTSRCT